MRRMVIADSAEKMRDIRPSWERVYNEDKHTIFQSYEWNELSARHFCQRESPFAVMAESDSGLVIIPAAINIKRKHLTLIGETLFDYRNVLSVGDESALDAAWAEVLSVAVERKLSFEMHSLRGEQAPTMAENHPWRGFEVELFTQAPCIRRQEQTGLHSRLRRNLRRLVKSGCELKRYSGAASPLLKRIYELKSLQGESLFRDQQRVAMLIAMAGSKHERCDVFTLEAGSTLVAALVTFVDGDWRRFYTTYHVHDERWVKNSPGLTLIHFAMEDSLSNDLDCDFMTGDQPYKRRLATSNIPLYRVSASADALADRLIADLTARVA